MEKQPCKDSKHTWQVDFDGIEMRCKYCPIKINRVLIEDSISKNMFRIIEEAERDWYIKELES